jgi:uncharacterized membrane protein
MIAFPCHRKPERCIRIGTWRLPICARCTGIVLGLTPGLFLPVLSHAAAALCLIPALIDGTGQLAGRWRSTNAMRLCTGLLAGLGLGCLLVIGLRECIRMVLGVGRFWNG